MSDIGRRGFIGRILGVGGTLFGWGLTAANRAGAASLFPSWGRRYGDSVVWGGTVSLQPDETPEAIRGLLRPVGQEGWQEVDCEVNGNTWVCTADVGPGPVYVGAALYYRKLGVDGVLWIRRVYLYRFQRWFRL